MMVNLPDEAACTICFSIDSLILLDSCYPVSTFLRLIQFLVRPTFLCECSLTFWACLGGIAILPFLIVPVFLRPPDSFAFPLIFPAPCAILSE